MGKTAKELIKKTVFSWWPVLVLCLIWALFSSPYFLKGKVPFPSTYLVTFFTPWSQTHGMPVKNNAMPDVITQIFPWKRVTIDTWKAGSIPLWNPFSFSGTAHLGNYQSAVFSPANLLFFLLPELHAWSLMILLQPILAGWFMYLFLRSLSVSREGSLLGAVGFMFSGFLVVWMAYGTLGYAALMLPIVLYGFSQFSKTRSLRFLALSSVALAWSFLSGHFQTSIYVFLYAVSFAVYLWKTKKTSLGFLLASAGLGLGISALQILPSLQSYTQAVRSSLFLRGEIIPWKYLFTLFSPDYYGNPVTRNDWFGHYAEWASYIGVVPLLLSAIALILGYSNKAVRYFSLMAAVSLLLAYESPVSELLFMLHIPVLSTSAASRIIVLFSFSLAVLSGMGMDLLAKHWQEKKTNAVYPPLLLPGVLLVLFWGLTVFIKLIPPDKTAIAIRNSLLPTAFAGISLVLVSFGFFLPKIGKTVVLWVLLLLAVGDGLRFASKWMPFDPPEFMYPQTSVVSKLKELTSSDASRVFGNIGGEVGVTFGLPLIEGYDAVYQYRYGKFISSVHDGSIRPVDRSVVVFDKHGMYAEPVLELLGTRYYVHKKGDGRLPWAYPFWEFPQYRRVWEDPNFEILENTAALPRVFLASSYRVATGDADILRMLYAETTNRRTTLLLEETPNPIPEEGDGNARIISYRVNSIDIDTVSSVPKLLFLSDVYDRGWHVSVDGKPGRMLRADYDFRAVALPKGTHRVTLWYFPDSFLVGLIISACSLIVVILGMIKRHV